MSDPTVRSEVSFAAVFESYTAYATDVIHGDFGTLHHSQSVLDLIVQALPRSLLLIGLALLIAAVGGVVVGFLSFDRVARRPSPAVVAFNVFGFAMPAFYLGIVSVQAMFLLSRQLGWSKTILPSSGYGLDGHLVLPVLVLAVRPTAEIARLTAELLAEELAKDYVRSAHAKGLPWRLVLLRHAFPNIATVIIVAIGNSMRYLLSSLIVVELLFSWPGIGRTLATAVAPRIDGRPSPAVLYDPELVAGLITALAMLSIVANYLTGITAQAIDPRLRD